MLSIRIQYRLSRSRRLVAVAAYSHGLESDRIRIRWRENYGGIHVNQSGIGIDYTVTWVRFISFLFF